jgi:hypothetical protein
MVEPWGVESLLRFACYDQVCVAFSSLLGRHSWLFDSDGVIGWEMVEPWGVEPQTSCMPCKRSTN